jgi:2-oxoglutarate ferredoxin oxidoreductase subunit beta
VEIYQNCPIFNDGAFDAIKDRDQQQARLVHLAQGQPVTVGAEDDRKVLVREGGKLVFVPEAEAGDREVIVHDRTRSRPEPAVRDQPDRRLGMTHVPMGIFRQVERPTYDDLVRGQLDAAIAAAGAPATDADLAALIAGKDTWTVA